jgi:thioredoxin reductase
MQQPGLTFLHGSVKAVDCGTMTASVLPHAATQTTELGYDYIVAATGFRRAWPTVPQSLTRKEYLSETHDHTALVRDAEDGVVVVGGGKQASLCGKDHDQQLMSAKVPSASKWPPKQK